MRNYEEGGANKGMVPRKGVSKSRRATAYKKEGGGGNH